MGIYHMDIWFNPMISVCVVMAHGESIMTTEIVEKAKELKELCLQLYEESTFTTWCVEINDETSDEWMSLTVGFNRDQEVFKLFDGLLAMCVYSDDASEVRIICLETVLEIVKMRRGKQIKHEEEMKAKFDKTA